jgi:hypothetical protein
MSTGPVRNPLHRLIDALNSYERALWRVHHANTTGARHQALDGWRACQPLAREEGRKDRDDAIRGLADPAKTWLANRNSRYVEREDFNLVEERAFCVAGFAVSGLPMSMPELYSERYTSREDLWEEWRRQSESHTALSDPRLSRRAGAEPAQAGRARDAEGEWRTAVSDVVLPRS